MEDRDKTHYEVFQEIFEDILNTDYSKVVEEYERKKDGRPRLYHTPRDLALEAISYFVQRLERNLPITLTGFVLYSKLNSRQGLYNYERYPEFKNVVLRIRLIIENYNVEQLYSNNFNAARFLLECNYNYMKTEKQIIEENNITVSIGNKKQSEE